MPHAGAEHAPAGPQESGIPPQPPYGQQPPPGAWGAPQPPRQPGGFRRFVGNRVTQLLAVGVLGLLVGGGIVGGVMAATYHGGRPGSSHFRDSRGGGYRDFRGAPGFGQGGLGSGGTSIGTGTGIGSGS
ncbi:hypothetical protein [Amycolatopsis sp. FDAARGOS 1241]|uniref:hypothetical protein n=1 Tax=Amycolatopsis sp. FDAARGOS 1241 TaxID=2778070 RepID=UPI001951962A|nr:hypothetical protein [Amycolatopsis sp. FDAARGOS 1241]QRP45848.1 hypothetical protein I6J71_43370 [Amycolatopsis sp. FDAARGOS 1241]